MLLTTVCFTFSCSCFSFHHALYLNVRFLSAPCAITPCPFSRCTSRKNRSWSVFIRDITSWREISNKPSIRVIVFLATRLLIFWSSLSRLRPALVADLSGRPPRGPLWCHVLALPPDRKGLSRLWVPLFGMIFPLNFVLCRVIFP